MFLFRKIVTPFFMPVSTCILLALVSLFDYVGRKGDKEGSGLDPQITPVKYASLLIVMNFTGQAGHAGFSAPVK